MLELGLRGKALLFTVGMAIALGLTLGGSSYHQLREGELDELESAARDVVDELARAAEQPLSRDDRALLAVLVRSAVQSPDVDHLAVFTSEGAPVASVGDASHVADVRGLLADTRVGVGRSGNRSTLRRPILRHASAGDESAVVGWVVATKSHARVQARLRESGRKLALTTLLIMSVAALVAALSVRHVLEPIAVMTAASRRMAEGDFTRELDEAAGSDEVRTLARALARMKESVQARADELHRARFRDLQRCNEQVAGANADLRRLSRRKSAFLADLSHQLRSPLKAIIGFSDMMRGGYLGDLTPEQAEVVGDVCAAGRNLQSLVDDVLDLAKIEAGQTELDPVETDLADLFEESVLAVRGLAETKGLELRVEGVAELGSGVVDGRRLKQVLVNLMGNAIKYTPSGRIWVRAHRLPVAVEAFADGELDLLRVSILDTGVGIAVEDRERIFSEFDRIDDRYSREQEGTGLGLALTKKLVELHGGSIDFTSEVGVGSEFRFQVPLASESLFAGLPGPSGRRGEEAPLVLVVEDQREGASLMRRLAEHAGCRARVALSGNDALALARELQPAAIVLDVTLPDRDGWSVVRELRADPATEPIPVLVLTGADDRDGAAYPGAAARLVRPTRCEEFLARLQGMLPATPEGPDAGTEELVAGTQRRNG